MKSAPPVNLERIERQRDAIYRRTPGRRVNTMDAAASFIDDVGFALLFASQQAIELPSLFEAVKGRRDAHIEDWDADSDRVWVWKNDLVATKRAYYGKALAGGKPVFIALRMLPFILATSSVGDIDEAYQHGLVSHDAKRLYGALEARGPAPTIALRIAAGMNNQSYHRALDELQRHRVVLPVGAVNEHGAWPSQIFDLTWRWFPRQTERAQRIDVAHARRKIVTQYVETVLACTLPMIMRVFGWRRDQTMETIDNLVARRILTKKGDWIVKHVK